MIKRFTNPTSVLRVDKPRDGTSRWPGVVDRRGPGGSRHLRQLSLALHRSARLLLDTTPPVADAGRADTDDHVDGERPGSVARLPLSHAVRSAHGLTSFLGLLTLDGILLEANRSASTPPELDAHDSLGRPFWEVAWWIWSPIVQHRLRATVAHAATGQAVRYNETALVRRNQLITVDVALVPCIKAGRSTALICSVIDLSEVTGGIR